MISVKDFNEMVWKFGAGSNINVCDECLSVIAQAWASVKDDVEDSSSDDTEEIDKEINSYYEDFMQAFLLNVLTNPYGSDEAISQWLYETVKQISSYNSVTEIQDELDSLYEASKTNEESKEKKND